MVKVNLPSPEFGVLCFVTWLFFLSADEVRLVVVNISAWRESMALLILNTRLVTSLLVE